MLLFDLFGNIVIAYMYIALAYLCSCSLLSALFVAVTTVCVMHSFKRYKYDYVIVFELMNGLRLLT
jgi:hypothetical protein